jgi:ABC-2 type transport system ATP-binding protein
LVGANGAGKTTTLRLLLGIQVPSRGTVRVGGMRPSRYRVRRGVGYLPEYPPRLPGWTVGALVAAGSAGSPARAEALLETAGLASLARRPVDRLSRGQARAAALAFALAPRPGLLLLDEPWSGRDPDAREGLTHLIRRLRDEGRTVVLSSHELLEVGRVADAVVELSAGRVMGGPAPGGPEVRSRPPSLLPRITRPDEGGR